MSRKTTKKEFGRIKVKLIPERNGGLHRRAMPYQGLLQKEEKHFSLRGTAQVTPNQGAIKRMSGSPNYRQPINNNNAVVCFGHNCVYLQPSISHRPQAPPPNSHTPGTFAHSEKLKHVSSPGLLKSEKTDFLKTANSIVSSSDFPFKLFENFMVLDAL